MDEEQCLILENQKLKAMLRSVLRNTGCTNMSIDRVIRECHISAWEKYNKEEK